MNEPKIIRGRQIKNPRNMKSCFADFFINTRVRTLCSRPLVNGVHEPTTSAITQKPAKHEKLFCWFLRYCSWLSSSFTTSYSASNCENASSKISCNCFADAVIRSCSPSVNGISITFWIPWRLITAGAPM